MYIHFLLPESLDSSDGRREMDGSERDESRLVDASVNGGRYGPRGGNEYEYDEGDDGGGGADGGRRGSGPHGGGLVRALTCTASSSSSSAAVAARRRRGEAEDALRGMMGWAAHMGVPAVVMPPVPLVEHRAGGGCDDDDDDDGGRRS